MRILCIGDSLGLPREGVRYEDTWFYKLHEKYPDHELVDMFERGLLITKANDNFDSYYNFYPSDIVIIQTGVCDCAPRYIIEEKIYVRCLLAIFEKLKLTSLFWKIVKKRGRKPTCVDTPIELFGSEFSDLIRKLIHNGANHVIVVKIGHATEEVIKRNPFFNTNVDRYNKEIDRIGVAYPNNVAIINPLDNADKDFFVDGYHCNKLGMEKVYQGLGKELEEILNVGL